MPPNVLESRRRAAADDLSTIVTEIETYLQREDADTESADYTALREQRDDAQGTLADIIATIDARRQAQHVPAAPGGEQLSPMRLVLREYDRGNSPRFNIEYELQRELQTGDPYFTPSPTRIQVATLPVITPSLDVVRTVQTANSYDFVVPPPPEMATTVAEGAKKRTIDWVSTKVAGTLETDALIIDVTRQTLEDDASAERTLRAWLVDGVRLRQDAKVQAAIAGATGTLTASGATVAAAIRNGKSELSEVGVVATAAYLNPTDAAALDLAAPATAGYPGVASAWGMRIVESPAVAAGAPIVGSMGQAVYLVYRNAIATYITDSGTTDETTPRDRFAHNLLGILGEGRSRAHVVQPKLLVKCTVTP
jgi:hypothetical protein